MMLQKVLIISMLFASTLSGQTLPAGARKILDNHFPGWKIEDDSVITHDRHKKQIVKHHQKLFTCNLNGNKVSDFAIAIAWKDTLTMESFVALADSADQYVAYTLYTHNKPRASDQNDEGLDFFIEKSGKLITNFGFEDEQNLPDEKKDFRRRFKTDCITLAWHQGSACTTFVFENGKLRKFVCGD